MIRIHSFIGTANAIDDAQTGSQSSLKAEFLSKAASLRTVPIAQIRYFTSAV